MKTKLPFLFNEAALIAQGWAVEYAMGSLYGYSASTKNPLDRHILLKNEAQNVKIHLNYDVRRRNKKKDQYVSFDGHTSFLIGDSWSTFDRYGVEDSFYLKPVGIVVRSKWDNQDLNVAVAEQMARITERREKLAAAGGFISIPDLGFRVVRARLDEMTAALKAGKGTSLSPSGFGRGYFLKANIGRGYLGQWKRASEELKKFFSVDSLYYMETEHD